MVALPLPPITTLLSETPKFSYSKPFHKSSRKRPNLISNHNHFWIDSSILFNYSKPLISDHLTHGMVSLFAVCTTPLRVYKRGATCVSNFIACNKYSARKLMSWTFSCTRPLWLILVKDHLL